ncbi:subunit of tubulin prefoldin [Ophidiomyces ophidiicola]|nr:subunit of tubulin prefoldin [Ophidiomyces ophidiicola]KAI1932958.1 subunit of tubulin prefoldin [Ophidiomyces ophidiicola]KAI1964199.1 subunit of tubulin prefoldin [Ophidiomyces ophidiicola]
MSQLDLDKAIDVAALSVPQLQSLQSQLNSEIEHLAVSHAKLRSAQSKFRECIRSMNDTLARNNSSIFKVEENRILVPLTNSLYVRGHLAGKEKVILDIGTGFYVEKSIAKATLFYDGKVEALHGNLRDLEKVLQGKSTNIRIIEDVLRQKLLASESISAENVAGS